MELRELVLDFLQRFHRLNPDDLKFCLEKLVKDDKYKIPELTPWYKDFQGYIEKTEKNKWISYGVYEIIENTIKITELPIGECIENYKQFLEKMESDDRIITFKNNSTDSKINFEIKFKKETLNQWEYAGTLEKNLKLTSNINATNMHVFNDKGEIVKMDTPEDIVYDFYRIRTEYHKLRKQNLEKQIKHDLDILESKVKFIKSIISEELIIFKRKKIDITKDLKKMKLYENPNYDYLLNMPVQTFSKEKIENLEESYNNKKVDYEKIVKTTIKDLWMDDLDKIE